MPMGAVIFMDFWLFRKIGLKPWFAEASGRAFNWAAGSAWILTIAACVSLVKFGGMQIFFVSLPGWFVAALFEAGLQLEDHPLFGQGNAALKNALLFGHETTVAWVVSEPMFGIE